MPNIIRNEQAAVIVKLIVKLGTWRYYFLLISGCLFDLFPTLRNSWLMIICILKTIQTLVVRVLLCKESRCLLVLKEEPKKQLR